MKSKLCSVLVVVFLVCSLFANVGNGQAQNVVIVDWNTGFSNQTLEVQTVHPSSNAMLGNSAVFQVFSGNGYMLSSADVYAQRVNSVGGVIIRAAVYNAAVQSGSFLVPSGSPLAVSEEVIFQYLQSSFVMVEFVFTGNNQIVLNSGSMYCLVIYAETAGLSAGVTGLRFGRTTQPDNFLARNSGFYNSAWNTNSNPLIFTVYGFDPNPPTPPPTPTPTPTPTLTPSPPVVVPSNVERVDLRFSDVERESFEHVGFGLVEKSGGVAVSVESVFPGNVDVAFGFRVWLVGEGGFERELTAGVPVAVSTFLAAEGNFSGFVSAQWDCPAVSLALGGNALRVVLYSAAEDGANTVARAVFVSPVLMSNQLVAASWTFTLHVDYELNGFVVSWSGRFGQAGVFGIIVSEPSPFDVMWFKLLGLDFFGFLLYPYVDTLGVGMFYVIIWVAILGAYYIWQQKVSGILLILVLFGSAGGVLFQFFPLPAMLLVWSLVTVGLGVLLFRLFR